MSSVISRPKLHQCFSKQSDKIFIFFELSVSFFASACRVQLTFHKIELRKNSNSPQEQWQPKLKQSVFAIAIKQLRRHYMRYIDSLAILLMIF